MCAIRQVRPTSPRRGLRIQGGRGHPAVRIALIRFAKWLRARDTFPVRVPVYLLPGKHLITIDGKAVSASFFAPFERRVEPYIRIATGDYPSLLRRHGRDNTLAAFIVPLSHEIIHYRQWIETGRTWETGVGKQAVEVMREYASSVDHP